MYGDILTAIESKFGGFIDTDRLTELYDTGELSPMLPDGCWWIAKADLHGNLQSIESIATSDLRHLPVKTSRDGGLLLRCQREDGFEVSAHYFPACDAAERFNEAHR